MILFRLVSFYNISALQVKQLLWIIVTNYFAFVLSKIIPD